MHAGRARFPSSGLHSTAERGTLVPTARQWAQYDRDRQTRPFCAARPRSWARILPGPTMPGWRATRTPSRWPRCSTSSPPRSPTSTPVCAGRPSSPAGSCSARRWPTRASGAPDDGDTSIASGDSVDGLVQLSVGSSACSPAHFPDIAATVATLDTDAVLDWAGDLAGRSARLRCTAGPATVRPRPRPPTRPRTPRRLRRVRPARPQHTDLRDQPYQRRRRALEKLLDPRLPPGLVPTPTSTDPDVAGTWLRGLRMVYGRAGVGGPPARSRRSPGWCPQGSVLPRRRCRRWPRARPPRMRAMAGR